MPRHTCLLLSQCSNFIMMLPRIASWLISRLWLWCLEFSHLIYQPIMLRFEFNTCCLLYRDVNCPWIHDSYQLWYKENYSNSTIYGFFVSCFMTSKYYRHISKKTSSNDLSSILCHLEINTTIIKEDWLKDIVRASKSKTMVKDSIVIGILTTNDEN